MKTIIYCSCVWSFTIDNNNSLSFNLTIHSFCDRQFPLWWHFNQIVNFRQWSEVLFILKLKVILAIAGKKSKNKLVNEEIINLPITNTYDKVDFARQSQSQNYTNDWIISYAMSLINVKLNNLSKVSFKTVL